MSGQPTRNTWLALAALLDPAGVRADAGLARSEADWLALFHLATGHLVAPSLHASLAARDWLGSVPPEIGAALEAIYLLNDQRNRRLRAVLRDTVRALNGAGIEPLLLKGAIALLPDQYPHAFARMLGDLDLAVAWTQIEAAAAALEAAGFYPAPNVDRALWQAMWRADRASHWLPLFHPSGDGYVELHRDLFGNRRQRAALPQPLVQARAQACDWDGLRLWIPAPEHRLLHNALHHQVKDRGFASDRRSLRQLLEFAQLRAWTAAADLDWPGLCRDLDRVGAGEPVRAWLLASQTLFGQPLPAGLRPGAAARRAEARFWLRLDHPRLNRLLEWRWQARSLAQRLGHLPWVLTTPAWYPFKYRQLRGRWLPARIAPPDLSPGETGPGC